MTAETLRVGVIGLGVGEQHINGFEADPRCAVTTLCDMNGMKLAEVAARYPGRRTTQDPEVVFADPNVDVVSIATYDDCHCGHVLKALAAGKHIFVEKPLCQHDEEFAEISAVLAAKPELHLSSNLILRKYPRFRRLKALVSEGTLGDLYYLEADYNYGRMEKLLDGWRGQRPYYSLVHGGGIHMLDLILWLTGERPTEVVAMATNRASRGSSFRFNDTIAALLRFPNGIVGKMTVNGPCVYPHFHDVVVHGTQATWRNARSAAQLYQSRDPSVEPLRLDDPYPGTSKSDLIPSFVGALLDGSDAEVKDEDVLNAMAVSLAVERAATSGQREVISYV